MVSRRRRHDDTLARGALFYQHGFAGEYFAGRITATSRFCFAHLLSVVIWQYFLKAGLLRHISPC